MTGRSGIGGRKVRKMRERERERQWIDTKTLKGKNCWKIRRKKKGERGQNDKTGTERCGRRERKRKERQKIYIEMVRAKCWEIGGRGN
jgi:hypothetical protein